MTVEYGIAYDTALDLLHRGPMALDEAREWIAEWEADGGRGGAFVIVQRTVSPWGPVDGTEEQ